MPNNFEQILKSIINIISNTINAYAYDWDRKSYESLVNLLLLEDDIAVKDAIDQIIKEKKDTGIPPLYLTSKKHPNYIVRNYCSKELAKLHNYQKIETITKNKNINDAINSLINEYGNFKYD